MPSPLPTGRQYQVRLIHNFDIRAGEYFVMAGITTSETMAGEQPKDDDLLRAINDIGSRLPELIAQNEKNSLEIARLSERYDRLKEEYGRKTKNNRK